MPSVCHFFLIYLFFNNKSGKTLYITYTFYCSNIDIHIQGTFFLNTRHNQLIVAKQLPEPMLTPLCLESFTGEQFHEKRSWT